MKWTEFKSLLSQRGLTQTEFARLTDTPQESVSRWQHNVRGVPRWAGLWLAQFKKGARRSR